jgi:hypothetical protein
VLLSNLGLGLNKVAYHSAQIAVRQDAVQQPMLPEAEAPAL